MKDLKTNLLRFHQREEIKADIASYDKILPHAKEDDKGGLIKRRELAKKTLETQSPEPLTGPEKDKLHRLEKKLRDRITTNMPTEEVMRKNPTGAVDWHQKWEKANKPLIMMWKNIKIQLNPDSQDRDLANIDRYRPSGQTDRMRTDAQIPGLMSYSNIDDEEWPFPKPENTALAQAQRHYDEQLAENDVNAAIEKLDAEPVETDRRYGPSGNLTLEEYTALDERLKVARAAMSKKRAEERQVKEALASVPVEAPAELTT